MAINLDHTGNGTITLKTPSSGDLVLVLPSSVGESGQVLTSDGSGNMNFAAPAGADEYARTLSLLGL